MIELTVRTLDSQNHAFTVEDDITVAQFKEKISETVDIPADTQRIIYCGRVLNDETKLSEYDVGGKVVHLVARAPPSEQRGSNSGSRNQSPHRVRPPPGFEGFEGLPRGNAMYLGSMAIPLEPQNLIPPPPSHSLAASRLNVAKRMLRRAELVINLLENPTARPSDVTPAEEPQEEVTPVFEARVIVPNVSNNPIDQAFVLNAVQNSLLNATTMPANSDTLPLGRQANTPQPTSFNSTTPQASNSETETTSARSVSSTPEGISPISTSTEDLTSEARGGSNNNTNGTTQSDNVSHTTEMADLLDILGRLQARFAPYLERYQQFMREDPIVAAEDARSTQAMINRVSEVLHFMGHAYHSLSDIIVRVRPPPPRPLLCRPILIQHSAVVQAGFPIQVEAQINFASEPTATNTTTGTQTTTTTTTTNNTTQPAGTTTGNAGANITMNPNILGFPLRPGSGFHVQTIPIGIRTIPRPANVNRNNGNAANANATSNANNTSNQNAGGIPAGFSNPNMEFFMEVTPERITIDSLETTLLGGQGEEMRGGVPPPELIQSIVQMASHLVNRGGQVPQNLQQQQEQPIDPSQSSESSSNSVNNPLNPGQNSQARGNTQTHPTTSTHTRSTARPHVHLAQHAMQGFDPFLPCNSHHISNRRRAQTRNVSNNNQNGSSSNARAQNGNTNAGQYNPVYNIVQGVLNSLQNIYARQRGTSQSATPPQATPANGADSQSGSSSTTANNLPMDLHQLFASMPNFANLLPHLQNVDPSNISSNGGPTIAQLLQQAGDQTEAEGIFNDLVMLLSRNFTIGDMLQLNSGRLEPLLRIRNELRNFFIDRVLDGSVTTSNVDRGVNRLLTEIQPFLENLTHLDVNHDIDIVRSTYMLFRTRLPNIINLATARTPNSIRMLVEQCRITARHLCALILFASSSGQRGVEEVLSRIVATYMEGISPDIQQWTLLATRAQLQQFISTLNVPASILQPYIVRNVDSLDVVQPMELDETSPTNIEILAELEQASGSTSELGAINLSRDEEELPAVILNSEQWHGQVPTDWVPIIARDAHRHRRQNQQPALSDAYLSGMPSKRRKIVTSTKPQGSLPQVITESIRRAVTSTGLTSVANLDVVSQEAGADVNIQSAYRDLLRANVQSSIQDNEDFTSDRFPNASNYFNKPH